MIKLILRLVILVPILGGFIIAIWMMFFWTIGSVIESFKDWWRSRQ